MASRTIACRVVVSGRVQGVFFRDSCQRQASRAGVTGWVRNLADGRVEAWLEGDTDAVARVTEWCRVGPARALVSTVSIEEEPPQGHQSFRIVD